MMMKRFLKFTLVLAVGCAPTLALAGGRILLIGDSHTTGEISSPKRDSNSPGIRLDELLRKQTSFSVTTYGSCGAQAGTYLRGTATTCGYFERDEDHVLSVAYPARHSTPVIDDLLTSLKPDYTVIFMGTNYANGYQDAGIRSSVRALVAEIKGAGAKCIWVGPPAARQIRGLTAVETQTRLAQVVSVISDAVKPDCIFVDTSDFVGYPDVGGDGMHYSALGGSGIDLAGKWAAAACDSITSAISGASDPICAQ